MTARHRAIDPGKTSSRPYEYEDDQLLVAFSYWRGNGQSLDNERRDVRLGEVFENDGERIALARI